MSAEIVLTSAAPKNASTLNVSSSAGFPTLGTYKLQVESELYTVTAVSGNVITVTAGSPSSSHNQGAVVSVSPTTGSGGVGGEVLYSALWNASTNLPALASGVGVKGTTYKVSVAGSTLLDGVSTWNVGDFVTFDGTAWDRLTGSATIANDIALGIPRKPQCVVTRCSIPDSWQSSQVFRSDYRYGHYVGPANVSQLQVGYCGYYLQPTNTADVNLGNDFNVDCDIEVISPSFSKSFYFGDSTTANIPDGCPLKLSNPMLGMVLAANQGIVIRQGYTAGNLAFKMPSAQNGNRTSNFVTDDGISSPSWNGQTHGTGSLTVPAGGSHFASWSYPGIIIGVPDVPIPSVCITGNSISRGVGDATGDSNGNIGYVARGLVLSATPSMLPYQFQGENGWAIARSGPTSAANMRAMWQYFTHFIICGGWMSEDILEGRTLLQIQTDLLAFCADIKKVLGPYGKPPQIYVTSPPPNTNAGNTVITSGFQAGQTRPLLIAWMPTQIGLGKIDGFIDAGTAMEDPARPGFWESGYSGDGTHPDTAAHILGAAPVKTAALTFIA